MALASWTGGEFARVELPTPEPRDSQIRVAVHAIGVNPVDWKMRTKGPLRLAARLVRPFRGPRGPIILGVDFAGVVEAVGAGADLAVGDRVVGGTNFARGQHGSYADTVVVDADQTCALPDAVSFETGCALPVPAVTAWMALTEYRPIGAGGRVLVLGASGSVGQFAVQLAKHTLGAALVVGVCSTANAGLVRGLGTDPVLCYDAGDALAQAAQLGRFDLVIDSAGGYPASRCRALLVPGGRHVMVAGSGPGDIAQMFVPPFRSRTILGRATRARLRAVVDAVAAGQVVVNIADRMPLADVGEALRRSERGRLTGKLVLLPR
jgi:NADPH:quinone reductase-like Zn-dependent oxidoreductase